MDFYTKSGSSAVDWCEYNYKHHPYIAEFFNTLSNILFFVIPPIMMILFKDFANNVTRGIHVIWLLLIAVGFGSVYFHATLTMAGQLMDELFILWVIMTSFTILFPEAYLPAFLRKNKSMFTYGLIIFTVVVTLFCCINPKLNAYFLMLFSIPVMTLLVLLVKGCNDQEIKVLGKRTVLFFGIAVAFWICDRIFCDLWIKLDMPYFHSIFHLLVLTSSSSCIVLFAYFTAINKVPHLMPTIEYWPKNSNKSIDVLCLPYVKFMKNPHIHTNGNHNDDKRNGDTEISLKIA